jgi:hypothetical protein
VFRGLRDEINVFSKVLSLEEIQAVQKAPARIPAQPVTLVATRQGDELVLSWDSTADYQLQYRTELGQGDWAAEPTPRQSTVARRPCASPSRVRPASID